MSELMIVIADPDDAYLERYAEAVEAASDGSAASLVIQRAHDGTTALELCQTHRPRLVVAEVVLEGLSGLELLRRLRTADPPSPAVVFVSHMNRESDRYWGLRMGAHAYLSKPFERENLVDRLRRALQNETPEAPV